MTVEQLDAYELIEKREITDIHSLSYVLKHKKSGAKIALLSNDDKNKVFYIGFRTPPKDSTGVAHILEHTVLCGSEKYPLKDPFIELAKGSLNTFLNAMTYPDKTVYPVASCNDKDFQNLMNVYLDAVFYPNIYKEEKIFLQEGWHYELEDAEDDLKINGVVYNEMKGVYSSPDDVVERKVMDSLFPGHTYGIESGGDPDVIPSLTYEEFLDFHRKYYHPSNSYVYLYGDMDMAEKLEFLDKEYLSKFDKIEVDSAIEEAPVFEKMQEFHAQYSVMSEEEMQDADYLAYAVNVGNGQNKEHYMAFPILDYAICAAQGAPVKKALIDKGIGEDVYSTLEMGIAKPYFSIIAKNTSRDLKEEFLNTIRDTAMELVEKGIDKKALLAGLNVFEFQYREADFGHYPKGLAYGLDMLDSWLYNDKMVFDFIEADEVYKKLREEIDNGYFENLLKECILENTNASMVIVTPKLNMNEEKEAVLHEKLQQYKASLSKEEVDRIVEGTIALREYQEMEEPLEVLETIPLLEREDIDKTGLKLKNQIVKANETDILMHDIETNGIAYLRYMFDISDLEEEMLPYLGLMKNLLGLLDTKNYSYAQLYNEIHIRTGGMGVLTNFFTNYENDSDYKLTLDVKTKVLYGQMKPAYEIMKELILETDFSDVKRIKELLLEMKSKMQSSFVSAGHSLAAARAMSYFSVGSKINEELKGLGQYRFIEELLNDFDEKIDETICIMQQLCRRIFVKERMLVDYTGTMEGLNEVKDISNALYFALSNEKEGRRAVTKIECKPLNEAFKTSGQVQFVCRAGNFRKNGLEYTGALKVLRVMMGYDYLWNNVRVKGGAYGCMSSFMRNGDCFFVSYRDPNLAKTVEVYENTGEYLRNFVADERTLTQYIIGTISEMDSPLSPAAYGVYCLSAYLSEITEEMIQKDRDEVLNVTEADIQKLAEYVDAMLDNQCICVVGTAPKIEESKELFGTIDNLFH